MSLAKRREATRLRVAKHRAKARQNVTLHADVTLHEKNEEAREEKSPHTPLKGEREEERKVPPNACARAGKARPTFDEVAAYCRKRGGKVDPNNWYDFYKSNGWKVGKVPMDDWKASVRRWERKEEKRHAAVAPKAAAFERQRAENEARKNRSEALAAQYIREINEAISHAH